MTQIFLGQKKAFAYKSQRQTKSRLTNRRFVKIFRLKIARLGSPKVLKAMPPVARTLIRD